MACHAGLNLSFLLVGMLLAMVTLPDFLAAGPAGERPHGDAGLVGGDKAEGPEVKKLVRNRRNISWYKQHSDFWNWYKYFTDNGNQEAVQELDRVYLAYLQNKNRAEGRRSYTHYLRHLGDIYKSCAESDDPDCVASYIEKPKSKAEAPKPAPVKACDPYRDPYCKPSSYAYMAPSSAKAPAPMQSPMVPMMGKAAGMGYYHYSAPTAQPFLSAQQKAELLRICDAKDVECLQYHLRASYGYKAASGPAPSYAFLGCSPQDPECQARQGQKAPSGMYHRYPTCDPNYDPYCVPNAAQNLEAGGAADRPCNPIYDDNCNPLTASKLSNPAAESKPRDAPAPSSSCDPRYNPYCLHHSAAAMQRQPSPPQPEDPSAHYLGPRGKTKEGYDCYMFYDKECYPLGNQNDARASAASTRPEVPRRPAYGDTRTDCHPFDPSCHMRTQHQQGSSEAYEPHVNADGSRNGVIEPDPDCDPEYDRNCRLRRAEEPQEQLFTTEEKVHKEQREEPIHYPDMPRQPLPQYPDMTEYDQQEQQQYDPYQSGQEDPYASYIPQDHGSPQHEDVMAGYGDMYPRYDDSQDHNAYSGEYRKK